MSMKYLHLRIFMKMLLMRFKEWIQVELPYWKKAIVTKWGTEKEGSERGVVLSDGCEKSANHYVKIDEEVYVSQPRGFPNPKSPEQSLQMVKALMGYINKLPKLEALAKSGSHDVDVILYRFQVTPKTSSLIADTHYLAIAKSIPLWPLLQTKLKMLLLQSAVGKVFYMIQNQMLDYGFNFMNTKIYIDNESTICIVKNPVYHSKTKHIAIRHHFIRDAYEKKLIQVLKIHTDDNIADLLTKAFDEDNMNESSVDESGKIHSIGEVATRPRNSVVPNRKPKDKPRFNKSAKRLFIKKQHHCESWLLFKSKKIAQVVRAWIKSKNSLVKHFEDMRLCRPSKEYLQVTQTYKNPSQSHTYSSNLSNCHSSLQALISLTDDLSLLSIMAALESCPKHNMITYLEKTKGNVEFHKVIDFLRRSYIYHALTDEGASSERLSDEQPSPSPAPTSEVPNESLNDSSSAQPTKTSKEELTQESKVCTKSLNQTREEVLQRRNPYSSKEIPVEVMPEDKIDHMETKNAQSEGRTREKEIEEEMLSTEDVVSTDKERVSTDFEKVSTDKPKVSTDGSKVSTEEQNEGTEEIFKGTEEQRESTEEKEESTAGQIEGTEDQSKEEIATPASQTSTQTPTSMIFGDDETIATLLINMSKAKAASKEKEKGVELKDVEETERPRPTSQRSLLTLKPLLKIDPKDKGKKKIEEDGGGGGGGWGLESDEELARKVQEEWEAEEERNRIAEEEATNEALIKNFDDIKARIEADIILVEKHQEQERERTVHNKERANSFMITMLLTEKISCSTKIRGHKKQTSNQKSIKKSDDDLLKACGKLQTF
ncbi:hypothetical protein Tco_0104795 [Tanacetum coccineum]